MTYFNTTNLKGAELKGATEKAKTQKEIILQLFKGSHFKHLSPSGIMRLTNNKWPITSIRRALTNLTHDRLLIKTTDQNLGMYGRPEHIWKLNEQGQTKLFYHVN